MTCGVKDKKEADKGCYVEGAFASTHTLTEALMQYASLASHIFPGPRLCPQVDCLASYAQSIARFEVSSRAVHDCESRHRVRCDWRVVDQSFLDSKRCRLDWCRRPQTRPAAVTIGTKSILAAAVRRFIDRLLMCRCARLSTAQECTLDWEA